MIDQAFNGQKVPGASRVVVADEDELEAFKYSMQQPGVVTK